VDHPQSLLTRGMEAITGWQLELTRVDADPEKLFNNAVAAGKRGETTEAIKLATIAADQGHARAQELLGALYSLCAEDDIRDYTQAYVWYDLAAEHLVDTDYWWLRDDVIKSRDWVGRLMSPAQVSDAKRRASAWAPKRSGDGRATDDAESQFDIGQAYHDGDGVILNFCLAVKWWLEAGEQGCAAAQHELGAAYSNGIGVDKDLINGHAWFNLAWISNRSVGPRIFFTPSSEECRDQVEQMMTEEQIVEARQRAVELGKKYMTEEETIEAMAEAEKYTQGRE